MMATANDDDADGKLSISVMPDRWKSQQYQQQDDYKNIDDNLKEAPETWRFTDFGRVRERSRDGSIFSTDEVFNSASHLAATILVFLGSVLLIVDASAQGEPWKIVAFSMYGASLLFLFSMSTLHHGVEGPWERTFHMLDYLAIYPLIAGTFTPLCLVYFHDEPIGWAFFATVWFVALLGMLATAVCFERIPKWMSMTMYITLGWLGGCMLYWLIPVMGWSGASWLLVGGVFYTVGGYIFTTEQPNPYPGRFGFHEIWHVFVVLGAATHWWMMWMYVLPY